MPLARSVSARPKPSLGVVGLLGLVLLYAPTPFLTLALS